MKMMILKKSDTDRPEFGKVVTLIGPDCTFEGTLETGSNVCIEGLFRGHLKTDTGIIINNVGRVEADIVAEHVVVHGTVVGNIYARKQLDICATGRVKGDVEAEVVTVAKGGVLDGFCKMLSPPLGLPDLESRPSSSPLASAGGEEGSSPQNIRLIRPEKDNSQDFAVNQ